MARNIYSILREFNKDAEPAIKGHELIVHDAIKAAGEIERLDLIAALLKRVEANEFVCKQSVAGMVSFQMGNLRKRGLIKEVIEKTAATAATKTTLTVKVLSRLREFDGKNEPKMGSGEAWVYGAIPTAGIRRPDLVAKLEADIKAKTFETAQKPSGFISFHCGNLRKRGLIGEKSTEEERAVDTEAKVETSKSKKKAA